MKCNRCGSAMVYERFYGPDEHFLGWRCILCGEIVDQLILENRSAAGKQAGTKVRGRNRH
jgi:hypothetical protein